MEMYPFHSIKNIMHYVIGVSDVLILSIILDIIIQLWFLIFDTYLIARLELHGWIHWKYDYTYIGVAIVI